MKVKLSYVLIVLLLPAFAEAIDIETFLVNIQGFPLSLGRLTFVVSGLILIFKERVPILKNMIFLGFLLILSGITLASLIFDESDVFIQSLGFFLLFIGSYGNVNLWERQGGQKVVDFLFIFLFTYWTIISLTLSFGSSDLSYSELYKEGEAINHHVPGMLVSVSAAYIAVRYFYKENRLEFPGYAIFFISLLVCLYIESRSNFLVSFLMMVYIALRGRTQRIKRFARVIPILIVVSTSTYQIIQKNDILYRRFTLSDMEYQKRSSGMRVAYFEKGLEDFLSHPFGKGISDTRVEYKGRNLMIHNQYLTFLLGGGIITLTGLLIFVFGFVRVLLRISKFQADQAEPDYKFLFSLAISCTVFFITLFTIEMSGLFFFFMVSFLLFVDKEAMNYIRD